MSMMTNRHDHQAMMVACGIAESALGKTAKNPPVGCVITHQNRIIIACATADGGRPHAEFIALQQLKQKNIDAKQCHLYVTMEPCLHDDTTPSCAQLIIDSGIEYVTIASMDSDERTAEKSAAILGNADIKVVIYQHHHIQQRLGELYRGFHRRMTQNRPFIALKTATSQDGKIALGNQQSQWISNEESRRYGQILRCQYDAILVGAGTFYSDNPKLNQRISHHHPQPMRFILLGNHIDKEFILNNKKHADTYQQHSYFVTNQPLDFLSNDCVIEHDKNITSLVTKIADLGVNNLLIEGGATIASAFCQAQMIDRIYHFQSPKIIGNDGIATIGDLGMTNINDVHDFSLYEQRLFGDDVLLIYDR